MTLKPTINGPYKALNLSLPGPSITKDAIRAAHCTLVLQSHPDKTTDPAEHGANITKFCEVQEVYEPLSDEKRRTEYDKRFPKPVCPAPTPAQNVSSARRQRWFSYCPQGMCILSLDPYRK